MFTLSNIWTSCAGSIPCNGGHGVRVSYKQLGVANPRRRWRSHCMKRKKSLKMLWPMRIGRLQHLVLEPPFMLQGLRPMRYEICDKTASATEESHRDCCLWCLRSQQNPISLLKTTRQIAHYINNSIIERYMTQLFSLSKFNSALFSS